MLKYIYTHMYNIYTHIYIIYIYIYIRMYSMYCIFFFRNLHYCRPKPESFKSHLKLECTLLSNKNVKEKLLPYNKMDYLYS